MLFFTLNLKEFPIELTRIASGYSNSQKVNKSPHWNYTLYLNSSIKRFVSTYTNIYNDERLMFIITEILESLQIAELINNGK